MLLIPVYIIVFCVRDYIFLFNRSGTGVEFVRIYVLAFYILLYYIASALVFTVYDARIRDWIKAPIWKYVALAGFISLTLIAQEQLFRLTVLREGIEIITQFARLIYFTLWVSLFIYVSKRTYGFPRLK